MKIIEHIFNLLAPRSCMICGREGNLLCKWCEDDALPPLPTRCYKCLRLNPSSKTCSSCRSSTPVVHMWACSEYSGNAKKLVRHLKYDQFRDASKIIAHRMHNILPALPKDVLIVPVPAVNNHVRVRGFDQSVLIAKELASQRSLQYYDALRRSGKQQQVGTDWSHRKQQLKDVFRVKNTQYIKDAKILLVDDVVTSGATIETCATILKASGAKAVSAVVFAQTSKK